MDVHALARRMGENLVKIAALAKETEEMAGLLATRNLELHVVQQATGLLLLSSLASPAAADALEAAAVPADIPGVEIPAVEIPAVEMPAAEDGLEAAAVAAIPAAAVAAVPAAAVAAIPAAAVAAIPAADMHKHEDAVNGEIQEARVPKVGPKVVPIPRGGQAAIEFLRVKRKATPELQQQERESPRNKLSRKTSPIIHRKAESPKEKRPRMAREEEEKEDKIDTPKAKRMCTASVRLVDHGYEQQQQQNINPNIKMPTFAEREAYKRKYLEQQGKMGVGRRPAWWANSEEKLSADRMLVKK